MHARGIYKQFVDECFVLRYLFYFCVQEVNSARNRWRSL